MLWREFKRMILDCRWFIVPFIVLDVVLEIFSDGVFDFNILLFLISRVFMISAIFYDSYENKTYRQGCILIGVVIAMIGGMIANLAGPFIGWMILCSYALSFGIRKLMGFLGIRFPTVSNIKKSSID